MLRALFALLNLFPIKLRLWIVEGLIRLVVSFTPKHKRIARRNLEIAFPDSDAEWREKIIEKSYASLARLLVDFARLDRIDDAWLERNVEGSSLGRINEARRKRPNSGVLLATGHLGSFELLAHAVTHFHGPIAFVVRNFKADKIDQWWTARREQNGNRVISRKGAFKELARHLSDGWDVAVLFDQNVTPKHAVFVDFFGVKAATTKTLALAALRAEASVIVSGILYLGGDRYRVETQECEVSDIYGNSSLTTDEKVFLITQRISLAYESIIRLQPEAWFWMHRRWKTRPNPSDAPVY